MAIDIDSAMVVAVISGTVSILTVLGAKLLSRMTERAQATRDESDAASKLSEAAAVQIKTYSEQVVTPLTERIDLLEGENSSLRGVLTEVNTRYEAERKFYGQQIEALQFKTRELEKSVDSQRDQIAILIEQSATKDLTIRRMQEEIEQLRSENVILREEVKLLRSENQILREKE